MSFHDSAVFPETISFGSSGGPGWATRVIVGDGGSESRVARWQGARHRYRVRNVNKTEGKAGELLRFFQARQGAAHGFRYKDFADWTTGPNHVETPAASPTDRRVLLKEGGDGTTTTFQLRKRYTSGNVTTWRTITKPMPTGWSTLTRDGYVEARNYIWVGNTLMVEGADWTLDHTTGVVTFATAPELGAAIYWSGAFHVPVRFAESADNLLDGSIDAGGLVSWDGTEIVEIVDTLDGSESWDPGGASSQALTESGAISVTGGAFQRIVPTVAGLSGSLPDPANLRPGEEIFVWNDGAEAYELRRHTGAFFLSLAGGTAIRLAVEGGTWRVA